MLIDSHAHIDYDYDFTTDQLLDQAKAAGVSNVIAIAANAGSLEPVRDLAEKYPQVYFTSGIHPHDSKDFDLDIFARIKLLSQHKKCVAIGELGLDYFYETSAPEAQHPALETQLAFSVECGKPVIVHTRDAEEDTIKFLSVHSRDFRAKYPTRSPGVIHCFTGSGPLAEACLQMGYYISFSGIITFKNAEDLRNTAKNIVPMDKLLVETDSPFLAPIPYRGKKNQPAYVVEVAKKIAEIKGLSFEEVARITSLNTKALFGF